MLVPLLGVSTLISACDLSINSTTNTANGTAANGAPGTPSSGSGTGATSSASATPSAAAGSTDPDIGPNLLVNGDAERGPHSSDGSSVPTIPGWTPGTAGLTVNSWSITAGGYPHPSDPGPADRGAAYFAGGPSNAKSSVSQSIFFTAAELARIATGSEGFRLTGWLGGYAGQDDSVTVQYLFINAKGGGGSRDFQGIGPVKDAARHGATGLVYQATSGTVPANAARVVITVTSTRFSGSYNDGYADDISFELQT